MNTVPNDLRGKGLARHVLWKLGWCHRCRHHNSSRIQPWTCYWCIVEASNLVSDESRTCTVCSQRLRVSRRSCRNPLCSGQSAYRKFGKVYAIAYLDQNTALYRAIWAKMGGSRRFLTPLGRLLAGYILLDLSTFSIYDIVTGVPMHSARRETRGFDQVQEIMRVASRSLRRRFGEQIDTQETPCLIKVRSTDSVKDLDYWHSAAELKHSIRVNPDRVNDVRGSRVLVIDDVLTTGSTLNECARVLARCGASGVDGLVITRQPWTY